MPRAETANITPDQASHPASTRRGLLGLTAGAVVAGIVPVGAAHAAEVQRPGGRTFVSEHPDAELIRLCAQHALNRDAYNNDDGDLPADECPFWLAYASTRDAISDAHPRTMEGFLAKARAAKVEAMTPNGEDPHDNGPAAQWAWDLMNDMLAGRVSL